MTQTLSTAAQQRAPGCKWHLARGASASERLRHPAPGPRARFGADAGSRRASGLGVSGARPGQGLPAACRPSGYRTGVVPSDNRSSTRRHGAGRSDGDSAEAAPTEDTVTQALSTASTVTVLAESVSFAPGPGRLWRWPHSGRHDGPGRAAGRARHGPVTGQAAGAGRTGGCVSPAPRADNEDLQSRSPYTSP